MLLLKKVKYWKIFKGCCCGKVYCGFDVNFGEFGLIMLEDGFIIVCQIEVVCVVMICKVKCGVKVWICLFLDKLLIKKLVEIWMGKGKGFLEYWVVVVKLGKVFYEMEGVFEELVVEVFVLVVVKLFVKMKVVCKGDILWSC